MSKWEYECAGYVRCEAVFGLSWKVFLFLSKAVFTVQIVLRRAYSWMLIFTFRDKLFAVFSEKKEEVGSRAPGRRSYRKLCTETSCWRMTTLFMEPKPFLMKSSWEQPPNWPPVLSNEAGGGGVIVTKYFYFSASVGARVCPIRRSVSMKPQSASYTVSSTSFFYRYSCKKKTKKWKDSAESMLY